MFNSLIIGIIFWLNICSSKNKFIKFLAFWFLEKYCLYELYDSQLLNFIFLDDFNELKFWFIKQSSASKIVSSFKFLNSPPFLSIDVFSFKIVLKLFSFLPL